MESREQLEDKINYLVFTLLTQEQYDKYVEFCEKSSYPVEGGA